MANQIPKLGACLFKQACLFGKIRYQNICNVEKEVVLYVSVIIVASSMLKVELGASGVRTCCDCRLSLLIGFLAVLVVQSG